MTRHGGAAAVPNKTPECWFLLMRDLISEVLRHYPYDCRPLSVRKLGSAGGFSGARIWKLTTDRGELALRQWPREHPSPEGLQFIHDVLRHASEQGVKILPVPWQTTKGATFVSQGGHLWELEPWLPGEASYEAHPTAGKLTAAMRALAEFHAATAGFPQPPGNSGKQQDSVTVAPAVEQRWRGLRWLAQQNLRDLRQALQPDVFPELWSLAGHFFRLLPAACSPAMSRLEPLLKVPLPQQPCIRDIWHDHLLFSGEELTGIVDFSTLRMDTPAVDIARLLGSLVDDDWAGWERGLQAYETVRPISKSEAQAVPALDSASSILAGWNWVRWVFLDLRQFPDKQAVLRRFTLILRRIENFISTTHFSPA